MRETLAGVEFIILNADDYLADFSTRFEHLEQDLWKLERQQEFREPGYPSWDAFAAGRTEESLSLAEEERSGIAEFQRGLSVRGIMLHRARLVASPPTPYLWWESHILRIREEAGELIRAVDVEAIASLEAGDWTLPEVVTLGMTVMYLVQYDSDGALSGAHRYEQADLVETWVRFIRQLFDRGEPFGDYYRREIKDVVP
ncbi:hypothetical protein BJ973_001125 [Actinoplanes tereljensis]|uniref:DUF6879 domain-containing protein n=1 Tax=Paractinoplanes tereljensis TaxID=571912 RepID=A0A919NXP9_9ACTN|nr:DUF6879 family protein [Actinoplanes tereljensis]GIF26678.1 hypothetical protein Ate02nite_94080 [Actinoplanes tereljensis]